MTVEDCLIIVRNKACLATDNSTHRPFDAGHVTDHLEHALTMSGCSGHGAAHLIDRIDLSSTTRAR